MTAGVQAAILLLTMYQENTPLDLFISEVQLAKVFIIPLNQILCLMNTKISKST